MATKILILAANPKDTTRLRLDEEVREIENGLQRAQKRDDFKIKAQWAVRRQDVRRAMLDFRPNIVHFCGHGKIARLEGKAKPVHSLELGGLDEIDGRKLIEAIDDEFFGSDEDWETLIEFYNGNPLALDLAAKRIQEVFSGNIVTAALQELY